MGVVTVATATEILNAARGYVWAAIAAVVLWKLYPQLKQILEKRGFKIRAFGAELTVQEASDQLQELATGLQKQVTSLQEQVGALRERFGDATDGAVEPESPQPAKQATLRTPAILWVDDKPENNAFLMETVDSLGAMVQTTDTTAKAKELLANEEYQLVITDMGRNEGGRFKRDAGITLIRELSKAKIKVPIVVYASSKSVANYQHTALEAGASLVTASPSELLSQLRIPPTGVFEAQIADELQKAGYELAPTVLRGTVDFIVRTHGARYGVAVKHWTIPSSTSAEKAIANAKRAVDVHGLAGVVLVHRPSALEVPVQTPPGISIVPQAKLLAELARLGATTEVQE